MPNSCIVPANIAREADKLINSQGNIKDGVELLLKNNVVDAADESAKKRVAGSSETDAGDLLSKGLDKMAKQPFYTLNVGIGMSSNIFDD